MIGRFIIVVFSAALLALFSGNIPIAAESNSLILDQNNLNAPATQLFTAGGNGADLGFRMAGIEIESVDAEGLTYKSIMPVSSDIESFGTTGEEGLPELPLYAHLIGIPDQSGVTVNIVSSSFQIIDDIDVYPSQTPRGEGSNELLPFAKNESFYSENQFYPPEVVELGEPAICRDLRMIQVIINPVQYNPVTRQLKVYTSMDYNIAFEGSDNRNVKTRRSNNISESFLPLYRSLVPNADEILEAYEPVRGGYLILTPDIFADSAAVLGRWKHLKGYNVYVATASEIDPNGSSPTQMEVFNYVQNAYNTWDVPPEYVCIVGDEDYSSIYEIPDYPFGGYTSDHKYSCVDGDDFLTDIFVTRLSIAQYSYSISIPMNKILDYERNPYMTDPSHWQRALSVAGNVYAITPRLTVLWVRQKLLEHGFTHVDTSFRWYSGQSDPYLLGYFNSGPCLVSYRGWAGASGWYSPSFSIGDLDQIQNTNRIAPMASIVCGTGNFGYSECFGEKWLRMGYSASSYKGGPAFYGSTDGGTHTKWNNPIMIGYYWGILEEGIYNFAAAAFRGKIQLYNTFPRFNGSGGYVEQYFHTYNTLGDPELEIRTAVPKTMTVTHPSSIPVGTNIMTVNVTGFGGSPLEGAYVCLVKGEGVTEEVFVGGRTDSGGDITLDFSTSTADDMHVTVTARDYIPYEGICNVQAAPVAVGINAITIDDDNSGNSSGNNDGNCNPGETVELDITLRNFGNSVTATNVNATLTSNSYLISVTVADQSYGSIAPGSNATSGKFAIHLADHIPQGEHIILILNITSSQGSWTAAVPIDVKNMFFLHLQTSYPGNPNNRMDPGETSNLVFSLQNLGELAGTSITGGLTTSDPFVTILDETADFGNIGIGGTGSNSGSPFTVQINFDANNGHNVNFDLEMTSSNGSIATKTISAVIGSINSYDPVGPDDYGYYMYDNTDVGYTPAPTYDWFEISPYAGGPGTRINFSDTDDDAVVISLPFDMVYYGQSFDYMLVCTNGFVAFDTSTYDMAGNRWANFHNKQIPEVGAPPGLIAPFWDDLIYSGNAGVFKYYDSAAHRFIIEWKECMHPNPTPAHSPETFQMIIYDQDYHTTPTGDAEIVFQYHTVYNDDNDYWDFDRPGLYCTVGMQNLDNDDGLEYTFDNLYHPGAAVLQAGRAIKITTAYGLGIQPDIDCTPMSFFVNANVGQIIADTLNIANLGSNTLLFDLSVVTDIMLDTDSSPGISIRTTNSLPDPIKYINHPYAKADDQNQPVYPPVITSQGGPDQFGYVWIDSDEPNGPSVNWVDISSIGTQIYPGEDGYVNVTIGFSFPFYENNYSSVFVCSNGILTFGSGSTDWTNDPIPSSGSPNNFIAPFWDDLSPQSGHVYYYRDVANHRLIVSYEDVPYYPGGYNDGSLYFQAMLYQSGHIEMQYGTMNPENSSHGLTSNTIGIENSNGTDGLQVVYNSSYISSNMAIKFFPPTTWCYTDINSGAVDPGNDMDITVTFDATELDEGVYTGDIVINSNDHDEPSVYIPITFTVGPAGVPDISFDPSPIQDTLVQGQTEYRYLTIWNNGTADLTVELEAVEFNLVDISGDSDIQGDSNKGKVSEPPVILNNWLFVSPAADTLPPGDSLIAAITLDATTVGEGNYIGEIDITSNDPDTPTGTVPVNLTVITTGPECDYVVGDANNSGGYNGLDITYSVNYFKGGPAPPYSCECTPGNT
ncbi:MAG: hypothetical protein JSW64_13495, partial [Candidatus Zixiibacteriota bacterium]